MSCDDKFSEGRAVSDPRLKITLKDGGMSWKTQDMNFVTARECAARAALHIRKMDMYAVGGAESRKVDSGTMIVVTAYPDEDMQTICLAHNPEDGAIQVAVNGVTLFQATILCESFVFEMNKQMIGEAMNGAAI